MARQTKEDQIKELKNKLANTEKWLREEEERNIKLVRDAENEFMNSPTYIQMQEKLSFYKNLSDLNSINIGNLKKTLIQTRETARKVYNDNKRLMEDAGKDYTIGMTETSSNQIDYQKLMDKVNELQGKLYAKELDLKASTKEIERLGVLAANIRKENEQILNSENVNNALLQQLENYKVENERLKKELECHQYEELLNNGSTSNINERIEDFVVQSWQNRKKNKKKRGAPVKIKDDTIEIIIGMRERGCSIRDISKATNVSVGMVHKIIHK